MENFINVALASTVMMVIFAAWSVLISNMTAENEEG